MEYQRKRDNILAWPISDILEALKSDILLDKRFDGKVSLRSAGEVLKRPVVSIKNYGQASIFTFEDDWLIMNPVSEIFSRMNPVLFAKLYETVPHTKRSH